MKKASSLTVNELGGGSGKKRVKRIEYAEKSITECKVSKSYTFSCRMRIYSISYKCDKYNVRDMVTTRGDTGRDKGK
ncbi:hypothetical protein Hanom_Chr13g01182801 [Helianthus anomalus]